MTMAPERTGLDHLLKEKINFIFTRKTKVEDYEFSLCLAGAVARDEPVAVPDVGADQVGQGQAQVGPQEAQGPGKNQFKKVFFHLFPHRNKKMKPGDVLKQQLHSKTLHAQN